MVMALPFTGPAIMLMLMALVQTSLRIHMRAFDRHERREDDEPTSDEVTTPLSSLKTPLRIEQLGWTRADAADVRARLQSFADDWDDPEMDVYDAL